MNKRLFIAVSLMGMMTGVSAQDTGQGQSIMFESQQQDRDYLTTLPESQKKKSLGDRCIEMQHAVEQLKGKPQRRSAMMDRYRKECELN